MISFQKIVRRGNLPSGAKNLACLEFDNWDDYSFKTLFYLTVFDSQGVKHNIGNVKIAYVGQESGFSEERIPERFKNLEGLNNKFFSLGQDADYYQNLVENLPRKIVNEILVCLGDVSINKKLLESVENEEAFKTSLLRYVNRSSISNQFLRVLNGGAALTEYSFLYESPSSDGYARFKLGFVVTPDSKPSSNLHVLIGRNSVGKTTLLNNMVNALLPDRGGNEDVGFFVTNGMFGEAKLKDDYFSGVVSISFSAFDPFTPPPDQLDPNRGICYRYIGLKNNQDTPRANEALKSPDKLRTELVESIKATLSYQGMRERWLSAVKKLESDGNFLAMNLCELADIAERDLTENREELVATAYERFEKLSSGHAIVLLSLTQLVESLGVKTLVLIDEPESHLHPPLLSAYTRALSDLLVKRNSVAIVATHSPVVLQEVSKSCVSILRRTGIFGSVDRPESETFAENVGVLTREVFRLDVSKSGFHELLFYAVNEGKSYEDIVHEYGDSLGLEGRSLLRAFIANREG